VTSSGGERNDHSIPAHGKTGSEGWPVEAGPNPRSKSDTAEIAPSPEIVEMPRSSKAANDRLTHDSARHHDRRSHDRLSDDTDGTSSPAHAKSAAVESPAAALCAGRSRQGQRQDQNTDAEQIVRFHTVTLRNDTASEPCTFACDNCVAREIRG
jgi:hypothetical protein